MKKFLALLFATLLSVCLFAGCTDPVYDDLENYLNVEMTEINADYTKMTTEVGKWQTIEDDEALAKNIKETILPLVDGSLTKLKDVNPATEEVKVIKDKYVLVMETYKEGFQALLEGCETQNEEKANVGQEKLTEAVNLLNEYNAALEELAAQYGSEVEY